MMVILVILVLIAIAAVVLVMGLIWGVSTSYDELGQVKKLKKKRGAQNTITDKRRK